MRLISNMKYDLSVSLSKKFGTSHPVTSAIEKLKQILSSLGFTFADAPEIDDEKYNFDLLNIPKYHPARTMHDTFYLNNGKLLRTHTSNIQGRMTEFPCRVASIGKVYRNDSDSTHIPMFHQVECFVVEDEVNMQHLKWTIEKVLKEFFCDQVELRFRASYFPFTFLSHEVDILYCENWIEVLGCGMIHPNVFQKNGFAFGMGIERLLMIKNNIEDIRELYKPDQRWFDGVKA